MAAGREHETLPMTRIVTTHNRYKAPPRKRKTVALEVPAVVTKASKSAGESSKLEVSHGDAEPGASPVTLARWQAMQPLFHRQGARDLPCSCYPSLRMTAASRRARQRCHDRSQRHAQSAMPAAQLAEQNILLHRLAPRDRSGSGFDQAR